MLDFTWSPHSNGRQIPRKLRRSVPIYPSSFITNRNPCRPSKALFHRISNPRRWNTSIPLPCHTVLIWHNWTQFTQNLERILGYQEIQYSGDQPFGIFNLAFPDYKMFPARLGQGAYVTAVSRYVWFSFILPEFGMSSWINFPVSAVVHVPVTPMNKNNLFIFWKNQVRCSRQISFMQPKPISQRMH